MPPAALDKQKEVEAQLQALSLEHQEHNERLEKGQGLVQVQHRDACQGFMCGMHLCNAPPFKLVLVQQILVPLLRSCSA